MRSSVASASRVNWLGIGDHWSRLIGSSICASGSAQSFAFGFRRALDWARVTSTQALKHAHVRFAHNASARMMAEPARAPEGALRGARRGDRAVRGGRGPAPVHLWNPPDCGDIDMRIAADGTWFYCGSPIGRAPLVQLFASILRKDERPLRPGDAGRKGRHQGRRRAVSGGRDARRGRTDDAAT